MMCYPFRTDTAESYRHTFACSAIMAVTVPPVYYNIDQHQLLIILEIYLCHFIYALVSDSV